MKKIYTIFILFLMYNYSFGQGVISAGMSGLQVRNTLNSNFDSAYKRIDTLRSDVDWLLEGGNNYISVKAYGAIGNGIHNDATAITNTLNAANGRIVFFPTGKYFVGTGVSVTVDTTINIVGDNAVLIAGNVPEGTAVLTISGNLHGPYSTITSNIAQGEYYMQLSNHPSMHLGDILMIKDDRSIWVGGGEYALNEDLVEVHSINSNDSVRFMNPTVSSYTTASNVEYYLLHSGKTVISGLTVIGSRYAAIYGIKLNYRNNVDIHNCKVSTTSYGGIGILWSLNGMIYNNIIDDSDYPGTGYGLMIGTTRSYDVHDNIFKEFRHSVVTGGWAASVDTYIHDNLMYSGIRKGTAGNVGGIGNHFGDIRNTITNNIIFGDGISTNCNTSIVSGNIIYVTESNQVGISVGAGYDDTDSLRHNVVIENNKIIKTCSKIGAYGLFLWGSDASSYFNDVVFRNNVISGTQYPVSVIGNHFQIKKFTFSNNTFYDNSATGRIGSTSMGNDHTYIEELNMTNNSFDSYFMVDVDSCKTFFYTGNISAVVYFSGVDDMIIRNNVFNCPGSGVDNFNEFLNSTNVLYFDNVIKENQHAGYHTAFLNIINLYNHENYSINCTAGFTNVNVTNDHTGTNYDW